MCKSVNQLCESVFKGLLDFFPTFLSGGFVGEGKRCGNRGETISIKYHSIFKKSNTWSTGYLTFFLIIDFTIS